MNFVIIIPVRFFSTRFPGKALVNIHGKPMVVRVMNIALSSDANRVIVATDDVRIMQAIQLEQSKGEVYLTQSVHRSGTERIAEIATLCNFSDDQIIVNLQGDEPLITPNMIKRVVTNLSIINTVSVATLAAPLYSLQEANNPNIVKVVVNIKKNALYFSRSMIPCFHKNIDLFGKTKKINNMLLRHIGIYAYRVNFLYRYIKWDPSPLEIIEQLEQLRTIWYGESIHVDVVNDNNNTMCVSVDTPEALSKINALT